MKKKIVNKRGGRKRMRLLSSSEEENEKNDQHISIELYGKKCKKCYTWKSSINIFITFSGKNETRSNEICKT